MDRFDWTSASNNALLITITRAASLIKSLPILSLFFTTAFFSNTVQAADTTPPTAPFGLTITAASTTQLNLSWTASTDDVGVTGYRIERCLFSTCSNFGQVATTTTTSYNNTGLAANTVYRYRIRAVDAAGNLSSYTSVVNGKTFSSDTQAPTAPASLTATPNSATQITLSWSAATDNVSVTGYRIERCADTGCSTYTQIATTTTALTYTNTGLTAATTYQYRVRANDASSNLSSYSNVATAVTQATDTQAPTVPIGLTITTVSTSQLNLSWTASTDNVGVTGYRIERCYFSTCSNFVQVATTTTPSYSNAGLAANTVYRYRIRAVDATGNLSSYSSIVNGKTLASDTQAPTAPANLTATASSATQINLSWSAATDNVGITGYRIERCTGATCTNYAQIATSITTAYSNTGLTTATSFRYRVRANDAAGNLSSYSSVVTVATQTVDTQAPTVPSGLAAIATSSTQINVSWLASTDNIGVAAYRVERCRGMGCSNFAQIATPSTNIFSDTDLTPATSYTYRVSAQDGANNVSAYSDNANVTTQYAGRVTFTYTYDSLGRINHASGSDGSAVDYQYDANGNVIKISRQ